jgi:hypothetical protein
MSLKNTHCDSARIEYRNYRRIKKHSKKHSIKMTRCFQHHELFVETKQIKIGV